MLERIEKLLKIGISKSFEEQINDLNFTDSLPLFHQRDKE